MINEGIKTIKVSERFNNREDVMRIAESLAMKGINLDLVTVHVKALAAYNNILDERISEEGYIHPVDQLRITSLVERLYSTPITKVIPLHKIQSVKNELIREGVEWVIQGTINARKLKREKTQTYNKLLQVILNEELSITLEYENV